MNVVCEIKETLQLLLPLWFLNGVIVPARLIWHGKCGFSWPPIDAKLTFLDGRRILGDSRSVPSFILNLVLGILIGFFFFTISYGVALALSVQIGSMFSSFIKRRLAVSSGDPFPILDQVDYLVGVLLVFPFFGYTLTIATLLCAMALTIPVHAVTNVIAFKLRLKSVSW